MRHPFYPSASIFTNLQRTAVLVGVVCFVFGVLVGWLLYALRESRQGLSVLPDPSVAGEIMLGTTTDVGTMERSARVYESAGEMIRVVDQKAGAAVFVAAVALSRPGWVAVREEVGGEGGRILGARWFPAGEYQGDVTLLRSTVSGGNYHAYLFLDDGDKRFDADKDTPITRNGLLVLSPFIAL